MNRLHILSSLVFLSFIVAAAANGLAQNPGPIQSYNVKIEFDDNNDKKEKTIIVPQSTLTTLLNRNTKSTLPKRKMPKSDRPLVPRNRVEQLANEFGLMEKTATNPGLVFVASDIDEWHKKNLDETSLMLEFAARRLILDEAHKLGVKLSKDMLSKNAKQVEPIIEKEWGKEILQNIACEGDTSEAFVKQSWDGLKDKDFVKTLACTKRAIDKWTSQADVQQTKATTRGCGETPTELKPYFVSHWALSDIATSWFIQGEVLRQQGKWAEAEEAYKTVIDKYHCAFTWDPRGWFWRTSDAAKEKYDEIRLK